jgi:hypothetical protein
MEMIEELTGCSHEEVVEAYTRHNGDIILTIDSLIQKPACKGDIYIPPPRSIETGLSEEQKERCLKGRDLQDKVNAVFSVAHSKIRTQPDPVALSDVEQPTVAATETAVAEPVVQSSLPDTA